MGMIPTKTASDLYKVVSDHVATHADLDGKAGDELLRAGAKVLERVGARIVEWHGAHFIFEAKIPTRATTTCRITFTAGTTNAINLEAGAVLWKTPWGARYRTAAALSISAGLSNGSTVLVNVEVQGGEATVAVRNPNALLQEEVAAFIREELVKL